MARMVLWIIGTLVLMYVAVVAYFYYRQEQFIFFPETVPVDYAWEFEANFEEVFIQSGHVKINALLFHVDDPKGVVLYHHGNARDMRDWANNYPHFTKRGYDVLFYDYRGFGKSGGKLSERKMHLDAREVYQFLRKRYQEDQIVQYGRSLGSGVATKLAKRVGTKLLLLETPYYSMRAMADKVMPFLPNAMVLRYPIRTDKFIRNTKAKIGIIHGTRDEMIPYQQAVNLSKLNFRCELTTVINGMHNDLEQYQEYDKWLDKWL